MGWISKDAWIYPAVPYKEGFREIVLKEDHEKVLAEKDREIVKWSELIGSFTRSQHRYLVEMERLKQALAEKDREIQQIREHEFQRGYQEAEEKYQQILEKSVNTEGAAMTRKELLTARANDVVEAALSREVCLSEAECTIVREVVLIELMRVEREVWGKVAEHCHAMHNDGYTLNDVLGCGNEGDIIKGASNDELRTIERWARAQQQELE